MANSEIESKKMWGGRFKQETSNAVEAFTESVSFDARLYREDIEGSIAHSAMLAKIGVLNDEEALQIKQGLSKIQTDIENGTFQWKIELEDVHMNIEYELTQMIGDAGKKLHTGRSRNDQVATDLRLYLRRQSDAIETHLQALLMQLLVMARAECETILPGYTHLQVAQPITLGHQLLAWFEMLERDLERLQQCRQRINVLPLGSAALAGTSFPIDREFVARELDFARPSRNSLDAVSDRDFLIEFASNASLIMLHFSRMCEEIILWATQNYEFISIGDAFCTGSSIMPQKKNPDIAELIRGKSARTIATLNHLLVLMKSQPLAYNRDNQEDKEPIFDCVDTLKNCIPMFAALLESINFNDENMRAAALRGYATATDLAEYLVRIDVPFRKAHEIVGKIVAYAIEQEKELVELCQEELQSFCPLIGEDIYQVLSLEGSVASRNHIGGTAPASVRAAIVAAEKRLKTL